MNRIATAAVVTAALSLAALAAAAPAASVADQIKKMEMDRAAAVVRADVAAIEAQTSDDYTLINVNGQLSGKTETMNAIRSGDIKLTANDLSDLSVRVYGNTAVVTGKSSPKGTIGGRELKGPVMFTRVYVKKAGRWQSVAFQQTPIAP